MNNPLAKQYNFSALIKFALPNMIMMLFSSLYTIVDGMFVSRFVNTTALSAVNMVFPLLSLEMAIAIMIATGGSAIIAKELGEGKTESANSNLTFLVIIVTILGILTAVLGNLFIDDILSSLGVSTLQYDMCRIYAQVLLIFAPFFFLQTAFQIFFVTAGKPTFGLIVISIAGLTNMILDYLFIVPMNMGIMGAALATGIGYSIPAVAGLIFFARTKKNTLHFVKPKFNSDVLLKTCTNGSSEMITNLANAITTFLFNYIFMKFWGEDGVASITIILYFQYVFTAIFFGYATGVSPLISYSFGSNDTAQLKKIIKSSLIFVLISSVFAYIISNISASALLKIFTSPDSNVYVLTNNGLKIYSLGFLLMGTSIFASAWFTALSDGKTSAIISFARTFIFLVVAILVLPYIIGTYGVWLAVPVAEIFGIIVSAMYLAKKQPTFEFN